MSPTPAQAEADYMAGLLQSLDVPIKTPARSSLSRPILSSSHHVPAPSPAHPARLEPGDTQLIDLTPRTPTKPNALCNSSSIDIELGDLFAGAEDWDLDDFVPSPRKPSPKKPSRSLAPQDTKTFQPEPCARFVVDLISEVLLDGQLDVHADKDMTDLRTIYLQDDWYHTDVREGDIVNAIGKFDQTVAGRPTIRITSPSNLLILHPDILLTATALSNAPQCSRKPLLSTLVRASNDISPALVWGNMLHEVMQKCLLEKRWEEAWINEQIDDVLLNGLGMLLALNVSVETARTELRRRAIGLQIFKERYIADAPKPDAVLSDTRAQANDTDALLAIPQLHEIEEDIWSPRYGLKGKVDATVEAIISEKPPMVSTNSVMNKYLTSSSAFNSRGSSSSASTPTLAAGPRPFEIKTGRSIAGLEHRAQTMLYTLLASERYGTEVPDGLLYYTQSDTVVRVPRSRNEIRGLIVARNELAGYMIKRVGREGDDKRKRDVDESEINIEEIGVQAEPFLPQPIDDEHTCKRCYVVDTCMLYRYAYSARSSKLPMLEEPPSELHTPGSLLDTYHLKTGHLTPEQGLFFRKWETLLSLEERDLMRFRRELWTLGADERERKGRCFAGMVVVPQEKGEEVQNGGSPAAGEGREYKFTYTFARSKTWVGGKDVEDEEGEQRNLLNGHLNIGDPVTLSVEPHLLALAQGFITDLTPEEVRLGVDHRIDVEWIRARMKMGGGGVGDGCEVVFRIDKDELFGGMGRMRNNIAQLFYANGDKKRLELVVDLRKPVFGPAPSAEDLASDEDTSQHVRHLNASQKEAVGKVLSVEDYALILGMPGTGKTTVISSLIKILVAQGKTVLLTSYTHSAVDTILRKLGQDAESKGEAELGFGVLRLGNLEKVHPDVRKYTLSARKKAETVEQLEAQWMRPPVVAATCLSVDHPVFSRRRFDYCIVDEASQITLPTCLGPLRYADKFILVGDHFQLPPLVKNPVARRGGLEVSLFRRLSDAHPESVIDLREQYRMNEDIMVLSNKLIYDDRLKCGSVEVATRKLALPNAGQCWLDACHRRQRSRSSKHGMPLPDTICVGVQAKRKCWLAHLADPNTAAVFVDTDTLGEGVAHDSRVGDLVQNEVEAGLVVQFVEALVGRWGVKKRDVGVISLYRQQVKLIKSLLAGANGKRGGNVKRENEADEEDEVEVLTADKSQGRDKECVVISMVRSNKEGKVGELVKDWRRMNVSFTRARSKLVIFGSRKTLKADPLLSQFFELMEGRGWVYELEKGSHLVHEEDIHGDILEEDEGVKAEEDTVGMEMDMTMVEDEGAFDGTLVDVNVDNKDVVEAKGVVEVEMDGVEPTLADLPVPPSSSPPTIIDVSKPSSTSKHRVIDDIDDDEVEIVDEFFSEPKPKPRSKSAQTSGKAKVKKQAKVIEIGSDDMVIDIQSEAEEDGDRVEIVGEKRAPPPTPPPQPKRSGFFVKKEKKVDGNEEKGKAKDKEGKAKEKGKAVVKQGSKSKASASSALAASTSKAPASAGAPTKAGSRSVSSGSLKRAHPSSVATKEKENTTAPSTKKGTLDRWFSAKSGATSSSTTSASSASSAGRKDGEDSIAAMEKPPPKKKARKSLVDDDEVEVVSVTTSTASSSGAAKGKKKSDSGGPARDKEAQMKKAKGLLKGRPILQELVSAEV